MKCYICGGNSLVDVLSKNAIAIWTGRSNTDALNLSRHKCRLLQCQHCGHVQQRVSKKLEKDLTTVYDSSHAQGSTAIGHGSWGKKRAEKVLEQMNFKGYQSVIEIGCADGYLLKFLSANGFTDLVGIEPSLTKCFTNGNIEFIKGYAHDKMDLKRKFDLIFSIATFEHIKNIHGIIDFADRHLEKDGDVFFEVPNASRQLLCGDPAAFIHEHIHYYTMNSIITLFSQHNMFVNAIHEIGDAFFVLAGKAKKNESDFDSRIIKYHQYSQLLDERIDYITHIVKAKKTAFHGVCNSLHNIVHWGKLEKFDFGLFDNDELKKEMLFWGKKVDIPNQNNISFFDTIIVVPSAYFDDISKCYKDLGFGGEIIRVAYEWK